jgi:two-component system, OmpR family, sensor kinase
VAFYAAIALVIMTWLWPLSRDLRALELAAAGYGDRNWRFVADIKPRSQIHRLAETFRRMAARIDGLIASHKDMSNAVAHEIRTPLSRMQFEIELAQQAASLPEVRGPLANIRSDVAAIDALVTAALDYAFLERADMTLNIGNHNFTTLIPAIAEQVQRDAQPNLRLASSVQEDAIAVRCDMHLMETVLRNLLYNACRYARSEIRVSFRAADGLNELRVDDDGPGIPEADRQRVFDSFVRLEALGARRSGFGLGLAIVKRVIEWHGGAASASSSPLGGASFRVAWPEALSRRAP